jgi:ubiquinol oxidase
MMPNSYVFLVIGLVFEWNKSLVCSWVSPTLLSPRLSGHETIRKVQISERKWSLIRSQRSVSEQSAVTPPDVDQSSAVRALQKLRDRQKKDLVETERMLEVISGQYDKNHPHQSVSSAAFSTAASLLVGTDYGFMSRSEGPPPTLKGSLASLSLNYGPPSNIFTLGIQQFVRNWKAILGEYSDERQVTLSGRQLELQEKLKKLRLNTTEIWERELADGPVDAPLVIKIPYLAVCYLLDVLFEGGYTPARFFLLETVARMPYFSYISMLHLYETLGFWRRSADAKRIHFAEELNEFAHLLIMESLGGDQKWWVRFIAQHSAIVYYFILCGLFAISPSLSYRFSELLETHAVNTYSVFLDNNKDLLKELPPTLAAVNYYSLGQSDPFYAEFQASPIVGHEVCLEYLWNVSTNILKTCAHLDFALDSSTRGTYAKSL